MFIAISPALLVSTCLVQALPPPGDVLIRGVTLYDGTGAPGRAGDLLLCGDRIVAVGTFPAPKNARVLDGTGLIAAPGFIDLHTHNDGPLAEAATRANLSYLYQGVTTVVTGNCGTGSPDVAAYLRKLQAQGVGSNVLHQIPHNDLRRKVMGNANRLPTPEELKKMEDLVDRGMREGAWGLSTGLYYIPGSFARTEELIALARVAARHDGFYASHMRDEGAGVLASIQEVLTIAREARIRVHISHLKAFGPRTWGRGVEEIALIEQARADGLRVTADQYPYTASSTLLAAELVPPRFREGTASDFLARLKDPVQGPQLREAVQGRIDELQAGKNVRIAGSAYKPAWQGKDLETLARREKKSVLELVLDIERHGGARIVNFSMSPEDVRLIMKQPFVATGSDGASLVMSDNFPHPRSYGCFPRKIGRFAIEEKLIPLEFALRSATGLPADILGLPERGYLRAGYFADVVVFDPKTFRDQATFEKPHQYATGVRYLFVNGKPVIEAGKHNGTLAGKVLRHE